jgi:undecaprenyl-diphosphatase
MLVGAMLLVTGVMLIVLGKLKPREGEYQSMTLGAALAVGCSQAFAILPGVSRSGSTILGGRLLGLKNDDSITFSFLLAIPAILGATVLTLKDLYEDHAAGIPIGYPMSELLAGAVVSFLVGIFALRWLIGWSRQDRLHWFAWWCIPAGMLVIAGFGLGFFSSP